MDRIETVFVSPDNALIPYSVLLTKGCSNDMTECEVIITALEVGLQIPIDKSTIYGCRRHFFTENPLVVDFFGKNKILKINSESPSAIMLFSVTNHQGHFVLFKRYNFYLNHL